MGSSRCALGLRAVVASLVVLGCGGGSRPVLREKLYVLDARGKHVYVIDPATRSVAYRIRVGRRPHGVAAAADGSVLYVSLERDDRLLWIDPVADEVVRSLPVGDKPNEIECTPDGRFVYVASEKDGSYWVVDAAAAKVVTRIHTGGEPHNVVITPDGKVMLLAPLGDPHRVTLVDARKHVVLGEIAFSDVVRPIAVSPDGARLYANVNGLAGFEVADLAERVRLHRIEVQMPEAIRARTPTVTKSISHGLEIRPGGRELWTVDDRGGLYVFDLTVEPPRQIAAVALGEAGDARGYWISFSPDGRVAYVSQPWLSQVSLLDADTRSLLATIPAGREPKRTLHYRRATAPVR